MDSEFAKRHNVLTKLKKEPMVVQVADGRPIASGTVTHETVTLTVQVRSAVEKTNIIKA